MKITMAFICCVICFKGVAQQKDRNDSNAIKQEIDSVNRMLDDAVMNKQYNTLNKHYADDFYFKHGTGQIDSKKSWIDNVMKPSSVYISRTHDSVIVELHKNIAIVTGMLKVYRIEDGKRTGYGLRYFRVFVLRKNVWQLLSHNTIRQWNLTE